MSYATIEPFHQIPSTIHKGVAPDVVTYRTLIGGFCRVERPQAALDLFHKMQACGQQPNP